jgi:hypothetical protein
VTDELLQAGWSRPPATWPDWMLDMAGRSSFLPPLPSASWNGSAPAWPQTPTSFDTSGGSLGNVGTWDVATSGWLGPALALAPGRGGGLLGQFWRPADELSMDPRTVTSRPAAWNAPMSPIPYLPPAFSSSPTPPAAPSGASISTTEDVRRTTPAALARGTALAFGGTGDARELAGKGISWALQKAGIEVSPETVQRARNALRSNPFAALVMAAPTSEDLTEKVESVTGPLYQPQTGVGKYVNSALEFVPGAVTGGPVAGGLRALPGAAFRYGVIPGLASEAAGHATEGTAAEPWARLGAALASGGAAGYLEHRSGPRAAAPSRPTVEQPPRPAVAGDLPVASPGNSERSLPRSLEGRSAGLYEPPVKPQRPFSADYPSGAPTDASGRLIADIEGRPLPAKHIAGRRVAGGADEALSPAQANSIIEEATGRLPKELSNRRMRGNAGLFYPSSREIEINRELIPKQKELTIWHETGHLLDDISAGKRGMSVKGLEPEVEDVYSTLNTGTEQASPRILPQDQGYSLLEAPYEYVAEALRAYMTNPNYFKTVAPNTAAAIRALVNSHPQLSKLIQFNSLAGLAALGGALGTTNNDERNL